jgi:hypothetical protein
MKTEKVIAGTYELELVPNLRKYVDLLRINEVKFIDTSICYNNDYLLRELQDFKLISKIPPQFTEYYDFFMRHHLANLGRDKIDIMLIHNPRANWIAIAEMLEKDPRVVEVGVSNFTTDDLMRYKEVFGHYPKYNEVEVNPKYTDLECLKFCKENDIKVIGYAIFGGKYNARKNISTYTMSGLLEFANSYCDLFIIRADDEYQLSNILTAEVKEDRLSPIAPSFDKKSIVPMEYDLPLFSRYEVKKNTYMITYSKTLGSGSLTDVQPHYITMDDVSRNLLSRVLEVMPKLDDFEFITDFRVAFRYALGQVYEMARFRYLDEMLIVEVEDKLFVFNCLFIDSKNRLTKINKDCKPLIQGYMIQDELPRSYSLA